MIVKLGNLPQVGVKIKNVSNHHLVLICKSKTSIVFSNGLFKMDISLVNGPLFGGTCYFLGGRASVQM